MSEFGKGFLYPLALFLAHQDSLRSSLETYKSIGMGEARAVEAWLYGASDHLFEFNSEYAPQPLRERCRALRTAALAKRLPMGSEARPTLADAHRMIDEAKSIFLEVDKINGVDAEEAQWS